MKLLRKLIDPVPLVAQGFIVGAALFFATHPGSGEALAAQIDSSFAEQGRSTTQL